MDAQAFTSSSDDFEDYFNFEDSTYLEKENTMRNIHQDVSADTSLATTPAKNKQDYTVVNDKEKPEQPELQESNLTELNSALDSELFGDEEDEDDDTELENALIDALNMPESKDEALSEQAFLKASAQHAHGLTLPTMDAPICEPEQPNIQHTIHQNTVLPSHGLTLPTGVPIISPTASSSQQVSETIPTHSVGAAVAKQVQSSTSTPVIDLNNVNDAINKSTPSAAAKPTTKRARSQDSQEGSSPKKARQASASPTIQHVFPPPRKGCLYANLSTAVLHNVPAGTTLMCRCQWRGKNLDVSEPCEIRCVRKERVSPRSSPLRINTNEALAAQLAGTTITSNVPQQMAAISQQMGQLQLPQMATSFNMPQNSDNFQLQPNLWSSIPMAMSMQPQQPLQMAMPYNIPQYAKQFQDFNGHFNAIPQIFPQQIVQPQQQQLAMQQNAHQFQNACQNLQMKYPNLTPAQIAETVRSYIRQGGQQQQQQRQCQQQQMQHQQQQIGMLQIFPQQQNGQQQMPPPKIF